MTGPALFSMTFGRLGIRSRLAAAVAVIATVALAVRCADPQAATQPADRSAARAGETEPSSKVPELAPVWENWDPDSLPGRVHSVERGETLYSIAAKYYGDSRQWRRIMVANRNRVKDERDLPVGMKLIIP